MTYEEAFVQHGIHPKYWAGMQAYVMTGARPDAELQVRLDYLQNYRDCLRDLMARTHQQPDLAPAIVPFESIEVPE